MRVGLVGCVKTKQTVPCLARDLYISPLFVGRRAYVERSCDRWYILSAKHGLVAPDQLLAPYEQTLTTMPARARQEWSRTVLAELRATVPFWRTIFEVHAGIEYRDSGLVDGLRGWGATVEVPTEGLPQGAQLKFYKRARLTA